MYLIFVISLLCQVYIAFANEPNTFTSLMNYIQKETASVSNAHHSIKQFLNSKNIPIGQVVSRNTNEKPKIEGYLITQSTKSNNVECRVSLEKVPVGSKCLAPCGCIGSQQWITFSTLNKLRRKDPEQWKICRTCQKPFDYGAISQFGGVQGNLLSLILDNKVMLRSVILTLLTIVSALIQLPLSIKRILVSKLVWQSYSRWSRIIHLPFVFQLWGGKIILQYIYTAYLQAEKKLLLKLTDIETAIVEPKLPITVMNTSQK